MACIVIQQAREYQPVVEYLVGELGFEHVQLREISGIAGKFQLMWITFMNGLDLLRHRRRLKEAEVIIAFSHFSTVIKVFARLGLLCYQRFFCFGFFIHSPGWFPLFRLLSRMDSSKDHYIVFSEQEIRLYADRLKIDSSRQHYLPYGDWAPEMPANTSSGAVDMAEGDYYFAGGYSNRDFRSVIRAFHQISAPLIIVCSRLNKDLDDICLPPNVRVFRDVDSEAYEAFIRHAKACIVPLKHDTGAAGQSTMLRLMRQRKLIIASDVGSMRGYVVNGVSGYLAQDMVAELPGLIARIERDPDASALLGEAAYERYCRHYSRQVVSNSLKQILI